MLLHCFPEKFEHWLYRHVAFQHFAFVIDSLPQSVPLHIDLHEGLVEMPQPSALSYSFHPSLPDLGCNQLSKPMPRVANRLIAIVDSALVETVFTSRSQSGNRR